jgi:hypothetical protein
MIEITDGSGIGKRKNEREKEKISGILKWRVEAVDVEWEGLGISKRKKRMICKRKWKQWTEVEDRCSRFKGI